MSSLTQLIRRVDRHRHAIGLDEILSELEDLEVGLDELSVWIGFDPAGYCRNPVWVGRHSELLALCWLPGQSSPIHDHRGSACGVRVLAGTARETRFVASGGGSRRGGGADLAVLDTRSWALGDVFGSQDRDIHRIANARRRPPRPLVTLHLYSPPLRDMRIYEMGAPAAAREVAAPVRRRGMARAGIGTARHARQPGHLR